MVAEVSHIVADPHTTSEIIYILAAILSGSAITGLMSWWKFHRNGKIEREELVSRAAEQAVKTLEVALRQLEVELLTSKRERDRIEHELRTAITERAQLEERVAQLGARIVTLEREVTRYQTLLSRMERKEKTPT